MKGIDISYYQGNVDFSKIKKQFEYVIIRLGLGDNVTSQDDVKYKEYIEGCKKYGIPYAFYFVSYAKRLSGSESVQSEIAHTERCMKGYEPFALFYDM
jgi:lysozyme